MEVLKDLQSSITESYETSFAQAFQTLESRLATHEVQLTEAKNNAAIANEARQTAECKILELQDEVAALKEELSHYDPQQTELEPPVAWADIEHEFAPERVWRTNQGDMDQARKFLEDKYRALYDTLETYGQTWGDLKTKLLQHKKKLLYMSRQLQRDEFTIATDGTQVTYQRVWKRGAGHANKSAVLSSPPQNNPPQATRSSGGAVENTNSTAVARNGPSAVGTSPRIKPEPSSQQLGSIPHAELNTANSLPRRDSETSESASDMLPQLPDLHTRKRKRATGTGQPQRPSSNAGRPVQVKHEPVSSSPSHNSIYALGQVFPSTQDLDDIGGTVQTPTKRHMQRTVRWDESVPEGRDQLSGPSTVLQPVDGNCRSAGILDRRPGNKKAKVIGERTLLSISEDGEVGDSNAHSNRARNRSVPGPAPPQVGTPSKPAQGRLEGLLEKPFRSRTPLVHSKGSSNTGSAKARKGIATEKSNLTNDTSSEQHSQSFQESTSQVDQNINPEDEPFRSRPLHRLTLDHFKINPQSNQGLDYAYTSVVRKKDERKCLAGCTRPDCCGGRFRAMARFGGIPAKSAAEQKEEDQRLLEDYVGNDLNSLSGLSVEEREELLVEARTRAIANQYGKHRHSHQRARSPPGFWRTDMPSTQEIESDREAAQRLEREKVEERYREAMRPGGLWTWADE